MSLSPPPHLVVLPACALAGRPTPPAAHHRRRRRRPAASALPLPPPYAPAREGAAEGEADAEVGDAVPASAEYDELDDSVMLPSASAFDSRLSPSSGQEGMQAPPAAASSVHHPLPPGFSWVEEVRRGNCKAGPTNEREGNFIPMVLRSSQCVALSCGRLFGGLEGEMEGEKGGGPGQSRVESSDRGDSRLQPRVSTGPPACRVTSAGLEMVLCLSLGLLLFLHARSPPSGAAPALPCFHLSRHDFILSVTLLLLGLRRQR